MKQRVHREVHPRKRKQLALSNLRITAQEVRFFTLNVQIVAPVYKTGRRGRKCVVHDRNNR